MSKRPIVVKDFLGKPAPMGYVAGAGRLGFTTKPDAGGENRPDLDEDLGYGGDMGLLSASRSEDPEDIEADRIYSSIDSVMSNRRRKYFKSKNSRQKPIQSQSSRIDSPLISNIFSDIKDSLMTVSESEWLSIPESGDRTTKRLRKSGMDRFIPVPDSLILSAALKSSSLSPADDEMEMSLMREKVLGSSIDKASLSSAPSVNDTESYLKGLSESTLSEVNVERARILVKGIIKGNPSNPDAWLTAIRLEESSGHPKIARSIAEQAVKLIPFDDELWLEFFKCSPADRKPEVLKKARENCKKSERIWVEAILHENVMGKVKLLKEALSELPKSFKIWQLLIEHVKDDRLDLLGVLGGACEACPSHVDFWISLAELESSENALKIFNTAIYHNPTSLKLWLKAGNLVPESYRDEFVGKAIESCKLFPKELIKHLDCDSDFVRHLLRKLFHETESTIQFDNPIAKKVYLEMQLEKDPLNELLAIECAQFDISLLARAIHNNQKSIKLWELYIQGLAREERKAALLQALEQCPEHEFFWTELLDLATSAEESLEIFNRAFKTGNILYRQAILLKSVQSPDYVKILLEGVAMFPIYEPLWLLLSAENPDVLGEAMKKCPNGIRLWVRSCSHLTSLPAIRAQLEKALKCNPRDEILWLCMLRATASANLFAQALKECPKSGLLYTEAVLFESRPLRKAQAVSALRKLPNDPNILCLIGRLLQSEKKYFEAEDYFKKALESAADYSDIYAYTILYLRELAANFLEPFMPESQIHELFKTLSPRTSALLPGSYEFTLDELISRVNSL